MRIRYKPAFRRDIRRIRDEDTIRSINAVIASLRAANSIREVSNIRRVRVSRGRSYRIRIGDYRLGVEMDGGTAVLARFLHRRDMYRYWP